MPSVNVLEIKKHDLAEKYSTFRSIQIMSINIEPNAVDNILSIFIEPGLLHRESSPVLLHLELSIHFGRITSNKSETIKNLINVNGFQICQY